MLMGNIPLTASNVPISPRYFDSLPQNFRESALLDRFHCFIEGWLLPRVNDSMIFRGWTINVEYFSEVLHTMRIQNTYNLLFDKITKFEEKADVRDSKAIKRMATAYMKLLFPHWVFNNTYRTFRICNPSYSSYILIVRMVVRFPYKL